MRYNKIYKIILVIVSITVILACDVLVTDIKARTNPNDENTTIQPPYNVIASVGVDSDERVSVALNWEWTNNDNETSVIGYIVLRKAGSAPTSVYDGKCVALINNTEEQSFFEWVDEDPDYPMGYTVYYAVFSYAVKGGDENMLDEDEKLQATTDDNGKFDVVYNRENYDFNGPVYDDVDIYAYADMAIQNDGYVYYLAMNMWETDSDTLVVSTDAGSAAYDISCLRFNVNEVPPGEFIAVYLRLRTKNNGTDGSVEVAPFTIDWENNTFAMIEMSSSVDSSYTKSLTVPGSGGSTCSVDVTDIFYAWRNGSIANYGLRLINESEPSASFQFYSSEDGDKDNNWPRLRIYYMNE